MRYKNKIVLVVGAGQAIGEGMGNGRAAAISYAREGAQLFLVDKDIKSVQATHDMLEKEVAYVFQADVTQENECKAMIDACVEHYGRIDVLHFNVGTNAGDSSVTSLTMQAWDRLIAVGVKSFVMTCKYLFPVMQQQQSGVVTAISSITSIISQSSHVGYKAAKVALNELVKTFAIEQAEFNIRVNAILPGYINTPMATVPLCDELDKTLDEVRAMRQSKVPMNTDEGTAWDIANASLFIGSDEARYITGVLLPVDGGVSAKIGGQ